MQRRKNSQLTLQQLPSEMIKEIASHLRFGDIVALTQLGDWFCRAVAPLRFVYQKVSIKKVMPPFSNYQRNMITTTTYSCSYMQLHKELIFQASQKKEWLRLINKAKVENLDVYHFVIGMLKEIGTLGLIAELPTVVGISLDQLVGINLFGLNGAAIGRVGSVIVTMAITAWLVYEFKQLRDDNYDVVQLIKEDSIAVERLSMRPSV